MKRLAILVAFASIFAACNNNAKLSSTAQKDSIQMMKLSMKAMQDSLRIDSFKRAETQRKEAVVAQAQAQRVASTRRSYSSSPRRTYVKGYSEYGTNTQVAQKRGWSSAAKGAAIGAGAGAITGILVDKKNARGAIIGGVVGAGTGYVIGRAKDRKTGRVQ